MRPVSARWATTVRSSHTIRVEARVVAAGSTGTDPDGTGIPILAGDISLDGQADIRSTVELETLAEWPRRATSLLAPYGAELWVRRGVQYSGESTEWVSLGYHRIDTAERDETTGPIRLASCPDRMAGLVDGRLTSPVQLAASTTRGSAVEQLVTDIYPDATIEWDSGDSTALGRSMILEEDRYAGLVDIIRAAGKTWRWDHRGHLVIEDPADTADPVATLNAGSGGVLISAGRRVTRQGVYNGVVARGEAADTEPPVQAVAVDTSPTSPTRWGGPFGKVPRFYSSPLLTSAASAQSAATTLLRQYLGMPYSVDFAAVPDAALEPGDPIRIRTADGITETHVIDRLTIPLTTAAMSGATREQTTVLIGQL